MGDLYNGNGKHADQLHAIVATYDYHDEPGRLLYQATRYAPKTFKQRRPDPDRPGEWIWNMDGVRRVLYRLPEVIAAISDKRDVFVVEGEKDADALVRLGLMATTNVGGGGKWRPEYSDTLRDAPGVIVIPDNDEPGRKHADAVCRDLPNARILTLPDLPPKGDVSDWLSRGGTREMLEDLARETLDAPRPQTPAQIHDVGELKGAVLTELATAKRLRDRHGKNLRHHTGLGWLAWDGRRWKRGDKGSIRAAQSMGEIIRKELHSLGVVSGDTAKAYYQHARDCERAAGVANILQHARALEGIDADSIEFDQDHWALNCANGTLDIRTGELRPHKREDYLTALCPTPYDPNATAPRWDRFLDEVFDDDADLKDYLQWAAGLSLSGCTEHDVFFIAHGNGANGKSTLLNTLLHVLGGEYGQQLDSETLLQQRHTRHSTELAMLRGVRLAVAIETAQGRRLNEPLIKALCGGDRMRARYMFHDSFEFAPSCKLFIGTNHAPNVRDDSAALWRRVRLIPFTRQFLGTDADPNVEGNLRNEAPGILAWAVRGIVERYEREPEVPQAVKAATQAYRAEQDVISTFVNDECETGPMHSVSIKRLYAAYVCFTGGHCETKRAFCDRIRAMGFETDRTYKERIVRGISLIENDLLQGHD